jgi:hypothetical protein
VEASREPVAHPVAALREGRRLDYSSWPVKATSGWQLQAASCSRGTLRSRQDPRRPRAEVRSGRSEAPTRGQSALFACTLDADGYLLEDSVVLSACAWAVGRILRDQTILTGFREEVLDYAEGLQKLSGVTKILADSFLSAVPDMVSGGVTVAVSTALGAIGGPLAAAGGAMAGSLAGRLAKSAVGMKGEEQAKTEAGGESRPRVRLDQAPLTGSDLYRFTAEPGLS